MRIRWLNTAERAFRRISERDQRAILAKLSRSAETGAGDVTRLVDRPEHRFRHRDWRVVFTRDDGILVIRFAHRSKVYR